ncbi:MAG: MFS transporter [Halanaerobiaceae bacterium]
MSESIAQFEQKVRVNSRTNFILNVLDGAFFSFGLGFISQTTILPFFVSQLTDSKILISLIMSIFMFGSTLPQLITANIAESLKKNIKAISIIGLLQRLPFFVLGIMVILIGKDNNVVLLLAFFLMWTAYSLLMGAISPFWFGMVSKVIPDNIRGKFFGYRSFLASLLQVTGAFLAGIIIKKYLFPTNFTILFFLTFITMMLSYAFVVSVREPAYPVSNNRLNIKDYFNKLLSIIKKEENFKMYLLSLLFTNFIGMINGLYTVAAVERFGLSGDAAGTLVSVSTVLLISFQSGSSIIWGHLSDKYGHKFVLVSAAVFNLIGALMAVIASTPMMFYLVFIFTGLAVGGSMVSFIAIVPDFCDQEDAPSYAAIVNIIRGLTVAVISLFGGFVVDIFNYQTAFTIAAVMMGIGLYILKTKVVEPRVK